jgi:hypothetical protein
MSPRSIRLAADEMVGVEFDDGGCNHVEEFLDADILLRRELRFDFTCIGVPSFHF